MRIKSRLSAAVPRSASARFALAAMSLACLSSPAAMAAPSWSATETAAFVPDGATAVGTLANGAPVHVAVGLTLQHRAELEQLVKSQSIAGNPAYHQFLTPEQFAAHYSPSEKQAKLVTDYLVSQGFRNVELSPNRLLITADGTAATARAAFATELTEYDYNGRRVFANSKPAQVPAALGGIVLSVIGLQNAHEGHTLLHPASAKPQASVGFLPTQFAHLYDADVLSPALGIPVAVFATGDLTQTLADLKQFETANSIPLTPTSVIVTGGGSTDTSGTPEWDLDSQDIVGISGGVKSITFYAGPSLSYTDMNTEFSKIVTDNSVPVINVSIGGCELSAKLSGATATSDQLFLQGTSQGQSFFISTGDSGSAECGRKPGQSWPAISPYVVAVGGTTLLSDGSGNYASETAWSGGGGGPSVTETRPSYQNGVVTDSGRGVPDIALDADPNTGSKIIVNGKTAQYGGTSLSAPLAAGAWARIITACNCGPTIGFATPIIYQYAATNPGFFHDVVAGSNGKYTAAAGWDYTTGFGSPIVGAIFGK